MSPAAILVYRANCRRPLFQKADAVFAAGIKRVRVVYLDIYQSHSKFVSDIASNGMTAAPGSQVDCGITVNRAFHAIIILCCHITPTQLTLLH